MRSGTAWFDPWVGVLAAVIVLTRRPVLDFGARAYVDIPYVVLVLGALLVETRRPRAGLPVLGLLAVAGLIRPEAWLFSAAYLAYLFWRGERDAGRLVRLATVAASGPLLWALADWALTGSPLHSLTGTRDTAATLGRVTGLDDVPLTVPRRLGEILREPVLLGAVGGLAPVVALAARPRAPGDRRGRARARGVLRPGGRGPADPRTLPPPPRRDRGDPLRRRRVRLAHAPGG